VISEVRPHTSARSWQARLPLFYGWIIVALGFFTAFFSIGMTWAAGLFAVPMQQELGWSRSAFFFAVSLRGWMGIVVAPLVGGYLDSRNGARVLAVLGGLLSSVTLMLIGGVSAVWQFVLLFGVLGGIAQTATSGISVAIVPKWFVRQRGLAVSVSTMGGGISAFVLPPLVAGIDDAYGWRGGWVVMGALAFLFATLPALLLRRQPEDVGLLPDGGRAPPVSTAVTAPADDGSFTLQQAMRTSTFWLLMAGVSIGALSNNGVPANITSMFVDRGLAFETAAAGLVAYGLASTLAKLGWGWLANRLPIRTALLLLSGYGLLAMPSIFLLPAGMAQAPLVYGFLVGSFVGAYVPLHGLVWVAYFGRRHVGAISGAGRPLGIAMLSGSPFLFAFTRDLTGSYAFSIVLTTAAIAVCGACLFLVRPPKPIGGRSDHGTVKDAREAQPTQA
jgi:sugar phosphate permease